MTEKQTLVAHIRAMHRRRPASPDSMTLLNLKAWHSGQHHRMAFLGHYHAGPNTGPGDRPRGWYTGEDACVRENGVDRCYCGCKYWENDRCIDCGGTDVDPG